MEWINDPEGLSNIIKWGRNYFSVFSHFYILTSEIRFLSTEFNRIVAQSNMFILDTMEELLCIFESGKYDNAKLSDLSLYRKDIKEKHDQYKKHIGKLIKKVSRFAEYQRLRQLVKF
jgi:hypothetical protein